MFDLDIIYMYKPNLFSIEKNFKTNLIFIDIRILFLNKYSLYLTLIFVHF